MKRIVPILMIALMLAGCGKQKHTSGAECKHDFWLDGEPIWLSDEILLRARMRGLVLPAPAFFDSEIEGREYEHVTTAPIFDPNSPGHPSLLAPRKSVAFWSKWSRRLPRAPAEIHRMQDRLSRTLELLSEIRELHVVEKDDASRRRVQRFEKAFLRERREAIAAGFPPEALTDDVLLEFGKRHESGGAWRVTYVDRLESQGIAREYLEHYREAWNLSVSE
jgi:hypothetical protein